MAPKKFTLSPFTACKWKALRRQKDHESSHLRSFRESYCRREHLGYCSENLKPTKKSEYTWFKISAPIVCTGSNLRYSWNHILQWTHTVPREQKGCQSTWMNHSWKPQQKRISWSEDCQGVASRTSKQNAGAVPQHKCVTGQEIHQELKKEYEWARSSAFTWRVKAWVLNIPCSPGLKQGQKRAHS